MKGMSDHRPWRVQIYHFDRTITDALSRTTSVLAVPGGRHLCSPPFRVLFLPCRCSVLCRCSILHRMIVSSFCFISWRVFHIESMIDVADDARHCPRITSFVFSSANGVRSLLRKEGVALKL